MNFIQKVLNLSTNNNNPLIPFDEVAAKNLWRYLKYGFVLMGVNSLDSIEQGVIKELQTDIMKKDFRYLPIFGYCMNGGYLLSFVIVNLNKAKEQRNFTTLRLFADEMSVKYRLQVSIYENPSYTPAISLIDTFFEDCLKENGLPHVCKGCYLNPSPMSYSERYIRDMKKNEIFIDI